MMVTGISALPGVALMHTGSLLPFLATVQHPCHGLSSSPNAVFSCVLVLPDHSVLNFGA